MSWFDNLFGENNHRDQTKRSLRRHSSQMTDEKETLIPQFNDVYHRPRGKFRFPVNMYDEKDLNQKHKSKVRENEESQNAYLFAKSNKPSFTLERGERRHRGARRFENTQANKNNHEQHKENMNANQQVKYPKSSSQHHINNSSRQERFDTKPTYHQKEFRASDVPSAIFGTKTPKAFKNSGLNQSPDTRHQTNAINGENKPGDNEYSSLKKENKHSTFRHKTPNYSKRDNTINIENVYASQIVEEIRREREKKVLQKKRFKEALEKERALKQKSAHSDIEKAISEMHAAQAQSLLGKDHKGQDDHTVSQFDQHEKSEVLNHDGATAVSDVKEAFEYEELDLSQFEASTADLKDRTDSDDERNVVTNHSVSERQQAFNHDDVTKNDGVAKLEEVSSDSNAIQPQQSDEMPKHIQLEESTVELDQQEKDKKEDISEPQLRPETSHQPLSSNDNLKQSENKASTHEPELKPEVSEQNESDQEETIQSETTTLNQKKGLQGDLKHTPIRKGSKPFNVVMTPSDKKRWRDGQNKRLQSKRDNVSNEQSDIVDVQQINEPDLKPSDSSIESQSSMQKSSEIVSNPELMESDRTEHLKEKSTLIRRGPNIKLPSIELLDETVIQETDEAWIQSKKDELNESFYYFNVPAEVVNVIEGPSVTRFELSVEKGVKVSRITALQDDIKMALAAKDIRIEAPIPGTSLVGIEVPNQSSTKVNLRSIIENRLFKNADSKLTVAMGSRINNEPLLMDIAKTPHALIAGATGSGKSVSINSILVSLLYRNHPEELKLLLIDPKMVELAPYNGLPHLVAPVITDVKAATQSLKWAVDEMEKRYKLFAQKHVRNITAYNKKVNYDERIPKIVIVIDELADLMMMAPQEVEQSISRIAQKARACGIHMLVATQRPSVNVITGLIKANIPTRIAFMVSSSVDSRTILDSGGAERLLGYDDMLYLGNGMNKPIRVQGTFVSDDEIDKVVEFIKSQREPEYLFHESELLKKTEEPVKDELFDEVCAFMVREKSVSTSLIQRHFQIGYNRAARIIDQLEQLGYISGANGSKPRDVYLTESDLKEI